MMRTLISMLIVAAAVVGLCSVTPGASASEAPAPAPAPQKAVVGGWKPIKNVNDPHIQEIGRWAVSEHVKQVHDGLVFDKVVSGEEQVVAGMKYKLVIQAMRGGRAAGTSGTFEATVYEKDSKTRQLLSFELAN